MSTYRYSRWDGSQSFDSLDPDELMDQMSEDLLRHGDIRRALQRLLRRGMPRGGERMKGLQDLLEQLRRHRQNELARYNLDSVLKDIRRRLDDIIQQERIGIQQREDQAQQRLEQEMAQGTVAKEHERLLQTLQRMAQRKREFLDGLPRDVAQTIKSLSNYEFMDNQAREQFQELLKELQQKMLEAHFGQMQQGLQNLTPQDLKALKDMARALNEMLEAQQRGERPNFNQFMQKYGQFFPPGIRNLQQLLQSLRRQMAQLQSLLNSMTPEQRQALQDALDALFKDKELQRELARLAANFRRMMPPGTSAPTYPFSGDEDLPLSHALDLMRRFQQMENLEGQLRQAQMLSQPGIVDVEKVRELMGEEAVQTLEQLNQLLQVLEDAGYVTRRGDRLEITPKALRRIGQKALRDIFAQLKKGRHGQHPMERAGAGGDSTYQAKPYEFGEPFLLDLQQTVMNAVFRQGPGTPLHLEPDDFQVFKTEFTTQSSTVLMIDLSRSMLTRGHYLAAMRVAMALDSLIRTQFPKDDLYLIGFSDRARLLQPHMLTEVGPSEYHYGTNMQHALMMARQLLGRSKGANKQVILITDGEPTAHLEGGEVFFAYPPAYQTIRQTLLEVQHCTREAIVINVFMLDQSPYLMEFVQEMTKINKGRVFFTSADRLGQYVLVDYLSNKVRSVR